MKSLRAGLWAAVLLASPATAAGGLDRVLAAKALTVAVTPVAPWVIRKPDGSYTGYDVDLLAALAKDLGVTLKLVETPFPALVGKVADGSVDVAATGLAITPERALKVVFSSPTGFTIVRTVAERTKGYRIAPGGEGTTIAVLAGSTDEAAARAFFPKAKLLPFNDSNAAISALIDGRAQAMVAKSPVPRLAIKLFDGHLRLVGPPLTKVAEGLALRPDDVRLQSYVNNWLAARSADGTLANLRNHWFANFDWVNTLQPVTARLPAKPIAKKP